MESSLEMNWEIASSVLGNEFRVNVLGDREFRVNLLGGGEFRVNVLGGGEFRVNVLGYGVFHVNVLGMESPWKCTGRWRVPCKFAGR